MEQITLDWGLQRRSYTVSELTAEMRSLLADEFADIWVAGEISGTKLPPSGHYYFTLKDESAQIRCVCYKLTARYLKFKPQDGVAVLARGRIDLYDARGEVQLVVEALEPQGHGALQFAFEQLKRKLAMEGLFDQARKRPLPSMPERIGIVTSPSGAVIRDMIHVLERRCPGRHIRLYPAQVQGEGAAEQIAAGIEYFAESGWPQVLIVARGGGSIEDLWAFNEERVARAIAASPVPVISAVGHETDFTIADFVADLRAPTPSAAAELVASTRQSLLEGLAGAEARLRQAARLTLALRARRFHAVAIDPARLHRTLGRRMQRIDELEYALRDGVRRAVDRGKRALDAAAARLIQRDVRLQFAESRRRVESHEAAVNQAIRLRLSRSRGELAPLAAHLAQLSPLKILDRGYAIVEREGPGERKLVKSPADAPVGSDVRVRLAVGELAARIIPAANERK
jgi:exodeoxyribonuclease VII large subunit